MTWVRTMSIRIGPIACCLIDHRFARHLIVSTT